MRRLTQSRKVAKKEIREQASLYRFDEFFLWLGLTQLTLQAISPGWVARPESSTGVFLRTRRGRLDHNTPILGVPHVRQQNATA